MLKISSYNVRGFKNTELDILDVLEQCDLLFIQEHWIPKHELHKLSSFHSQYRAKGISSTDYATCHIKGRPKGGLGIFWHSHIDSIVHPVIYDDEERIMGLKIYTSRGQFLILKVYLPYQCDSNKDLYIHRIGELQAIVEECDTSNSMILGDYNGDPVNNSMYGDLIYNFANETNLIAYLVIVYIFHVLHIPLLVKHTKLVVGLITSPHLILYTTL